MKFRLMINGNTPLDMFIHSEDDGKLYYDIWIEKSPKKKVSLAFHALRKRLKGNYKTCHPIGFVD